MPTVAILFIGLTIVIGGILAFRLHAFVALILAGLTVAMLTPSERVSRAAQLEASVGKTTIDGDAQLVLAEKPLKEWQGFIVAVDDGSGGALRKIGQLAKVVPTAEWQRPRPESVGPESSDPNDKEETSVCYAYDLDEDNKDAEATGTLHLMASRAYSDALDAGKQSFIKRLTTALGSYCGQLAILIVAASIIGRCLLDSGAADRIVRSALNTVGEKNAPAAFVASGFTLSIPVFFDTVFYLP